MYDMMVLAVPAFLVRIGLATGFRSYELQALACALALIVSFMFAMAPLRLGAPWIVAGRAGPW